MKQLIEVLFYVLVATIGAGLVFQSANVRDLQADARIATAHRALMHARIDTLEAVPDLGPYVGDLCVRVDRLEALAGIGGDDE